MTKRLENKWIFQDAINQTIYNLLIHCVSIGNKTMTQASKHNTLNEDGR